ncbi:MAG: septum formation protein Maf [Firmicutes bacterium]|nr:septum formation protein Maf [Bacillota bacterium]
MGYLKGRGVLELPAEPTDVGPRKLPSFFLASASPRRKLLLEQAGIPFQVLPVEGVEQEPLPGIAPETLVLSNASAKARAAGRLVWEGVVLGADTVVVLDGRILGKPAAADEAAGFLRSLSNRVHQVYTGLALLELPTGRLTSGHEVSGVKFRNLTEAEIEAYIATGEGADKAGGYGIQGRGALLVASVQGCYFNVVGLPLARLWRMLSGLGWDLRRTWGV